MIHRSHIFFRKIFVKQSIAYYYGYCNNYYFTYNFHNLANGLAPTTRKTNNNTNNTANYTNNQTSIIIFCVTILFLIIIICRNKNVTQKTNYNTTNDETNR